MAASTEFDNNETPTPQWNTVYEKEFAEYRVQLTIANDEMAAKLSLYPTKEKEALIDTQAVINILDENGVVDGYQIEAIDHLCLVACKGKKQTDIVVAMTHLPVPGDDGWIEPLIRTSADTAHRFTEKENGKLDLYTLNLFTSVEPEQKIAVIHPPQLGQPSTTVTGKIIPPLLGKKVDVRIGSGVRLDDEGHSFISEISGRAELVENTISVSEDYVVNGDVDLNIGNINFPGFAQISGDVLDNFDIRALKGIEVSGTVGSCHLISDGNISLGSMAGNGEGLIRCGGDLSVNYLNGVTVECMGTVTVKYEIRNCIIKSAQKVVVENGIVSGGKIIALQGIEAKDIGAEAGTATMLQSGVYFPEEDTLQMLKTKQKSIAIQNQFIKRSLGPLSNQVKKDTSMTGAIAKRLEILEDRLKLLTIMQKEVKQQLNEFVFAEHEGNAKINVHRRLKEKVTISLDMVTEEIRFEHQGPLSVIADSTNGILRFCDMTPLTINADEIELDELDDDTESESSEFTP